MDTEIQKIIKERVKELPVEVVMAIKSIPWVDKMKFIAKNNNLNKQKEVSFFTETVILVLGIESPTKYPTNLAKNVELDDNTVIKIAKEVDEQILTPITKMIEENNINKIQNEKNIQPAGFNKNRVIEIAQKYSLNQSQTDKLINIIKPVIGESQKPDTFLETVISSLGISRLLAEQIMEDLEVRVFEYALRTVEKKSEKVASSQQLASSKEEPKKPENPVNMSKTVFDTKPKVPEVKPDNLPMVEIGEVAHNSSKQLVASHQENTKPLNNTSPEPKPEPVQRPVEVPRFTGVPIEDEEHSSQQLVASRQENPIPINPVDVVEKKEVKSEPVKREHKYAVDPYRESIE